MKKYFLIARTQITTQFAYKYNLIFKFIMPLFQICMSVFIWLVIYKATAKVKNYTLDQMVTYIIVTSLMQILYSSDLAFRMTKLVKKGNLSFNLIRPYNIFTENLFYYLGSRALDFILIVLLFFILDAFHVIHIVVPGLLPAVLLISNFLLMFCLLSFIGTLSFWLIEMWTMRPILNALFGLLGGAFFPIDVLPAPLYQILRWNPFSIISFVNSKVLLGQFAWPAVIQYTCVSVLWSAFFFTLWLLLWKKGLKKYEAMGV